jgi:hypothetical protein
MKIAQNRWWNPVDSAGRAVPGRWPLPMYLAFDGREILSTGGQPQAGPWQPSPITPETNTGILWDGETVWMSRDDTVACFDDWLGGWRSVLVGNRTRGLAFDGVNVWVPFEHGVAVVDGARLDVVSRIQLDEPGLNAVFDGANMWVVSNSSLYKLTLGSCAFNSKGYIDPETGVFVPGGWGCTVAVSQPIPVPAFNLEGVTRGLVFDGANLWMTNGEADSVTKVRAGDGAVLGTYAVGKRPIGLAFDGANIWVANSGFVSNPLLPPSPRITFSGNSVTVLRASDGVAIATKTVPYPPVSVAFDGLSIYVGIAGPVDPVTGMYTFGALLKF